MITAIISAAGFEFYIKMHNQALTQEEISNMQQASTACLQELVKTTRKAGYMIGNHVPYVINGDSIYVFFRETQAVDTVLYYLEDYCDGELSGNVSYPDAQRPRKLMRKINGETPCIFSDNINDITINAPSATSITIHLVAQTMTPDEDYPHNGGFRYYPSSELIVLRNLKL